MFVIKIFELSNFFENHLEIKINDNDFAGWRFDVYYFQII